MWGRNGLAFCIDIDLNGSMARADHKDACCVRLTATGTVRYCSQDESYRESKCKT